jgi:hypothetical protein
MKKKTRRALKKAASSMSKAVALLALDFVGDTMTSILKGQLKGKRRGDNS